MVSAVQLPHLDSERIERRIAPWVDAHDGVVSLFRMLDFAAQEYAEITYWLGLIVAKFSPEMEAPNFGQILSKLLTDANRLGLTVTRDALWQMVDEMVGANPGKVKAQRQGEQIFLTATDMDISPERLRYHAESVYSILRSELRAVIFKAIPKEKAKYTSLEWLSGTVLFSKYPETVDEFQKAGRCFAYGENTACIFHLMRVTDFFLKKVGQSAGVDYDSNNWSGISHGITKKMEQKYQVKSDDWKQQEPFFAEVLTDIQAIGRGHRNKVLHELEKKYDEREAQYMLTVIEGFAIRVSEQL
jgi:hypothetical protein